MPHNQIQGSYDYANQLTAGKEVHWLRDYLFLLFAIKAADTWLLARGKVPLTWRTWWPTVAWVGGVAFRLVAMTFFAWVVGYAWHTAGVLIFLAIWAVVEWFIFKQYRKRVHWVRKLHAEGIEKHLPKVRDYLPGL